MTWQLQLGALQTDICRLLLVRSHMDAVLNGRGWKLRVLDGWTAKAGESEEVLVPPDNGPVLTIGTSKINGGLSISDLRYLARDLVDGGYEPEEVKLGDFEGLAFRYVEDDFYWRQWYLQAGHLWLQINYDCAVSERGKHDAAIDKMLKSLALDLGAI
jgi:hypothetical protein